MSYKDLYQSFQSRSPHISRKIIYPAVLADTGISKIRNVASTLDVRSCRGLYLSPGNQTHQLSKQLGGYIIVVARDLNFCWQRFVYVKELMHALDDENEATDSGEEFERVLSELSAPSSATKSLQFNSEIQAFWMALGLLCPENIRQELKKRHAAHQVSDRDVADILKIPEEYIPNLFSETFDRMLAKLI